REVLAAASHRPQTGATMRLRRVLLLLRRRLFAACAAATLLSPMVAALPPAITASATVPTPNLTIVSTSTWTEAGRSTALHVVGEVQNDDGTLAAASIQVDCRLVNLSGTTTYAEQTGSTDALILMPTEKSPFDVTFQTPPAYDHPTCAVSSVATPQQPDHSFSFQDLAVGPDGSGNMVLSGKIDNLDTIALSGALLYVTLYRNT